MEDSNEEIFLSNKDEATTQPQTTVVDLGPITYVIPEDPEPKSLDPQDELLRWHYCLGHMPFDRIKQLANKGHLSKRLLSCLTEFRQPLQVQSHLEMPRILVQLGHTQHT